MLQGSLIIVAFVVIAALMMTKKIPTLVALPLMAVVICIIAGVPAVGADAEGVQIGWLQTVLEAGTVRMGSAIMAVVFGAWLGQLMNKTGVTENIIKKSAELGGDRPLVVTLIMVVACAMAKIPLNKYYKWLLPFYGICFVVQCLFVIGAVAIGYC